MKSHHFDEAHVLHELAHFLPSQTPLKDFIHHNSLHAFQDLEFYEAIFTASKIFGYHVTLSMNEYRKLFKIGRISEEVLDRIIAGYEGTDDATQWKQRMLSENFDSVKNPRIGRLRAHWKTAYQIDLDNLVQPLLFRILCSYLDQGIALWHFPFEDQGLINAIRVLESNSFTSFFKTKRANTLLFDKEQCTLKNLLKIVVGKEDYFEQYLFDQQFSHRGWSGMAATIETQPHTLLYPKKIELRDVIILELLLEIDNLDYYIGKKWQPLTTQVTEPPLDLFAPIPWDPHNEMLALWQEAFEWSYYDEVISAVKHLRTTKTDLVSDQKLKSFQSIFCIDERECSIRRHLESVDAECETLGCPGFFGVEFFFQPENGKFYEKLCPAPVTPKYLIKEYNVKEKRKHEPFHSKKSHTFLQGFLLSLSMGLWAAVRLVLDIFRPKMSPAISDAFAHMNLEGQLTIENKSLDDCENGLQIGFTIEEMATRVEDLLRGIGMVNNFSPLVYVVAHGSSSANNPHHGAHDCGACSGRPGATNARVFAFMANHPKVRKILNANGLHIPDTTQFLGAMHDTASDELAFYDEAILTAENLRKHEEHKKTFEHALDLNAKERSRRFASIDTKAELHKVRKAVRRRSVSYFEPRPELGHGTNALCFVGHRRLTQGLFLDRRAFMNSYDYLTDPEGKLLLNVMRPLPPVCGGINLEYYFSRVDQQKMGAGTKLPHNVMGLIGVANSSDGDLRPGLPLQMIEVHDPIRLMIIVEHHPDVVLKTIQSDPNLYAWFEKKWVHLAAIDPETNEFYYFVNGAFVHYIPIKDEVELTQNIDQLIENAKKMETNHIVHATKENLPIHIIHHN